MPMGPNDRNDHENVWGYTPNRVAPILFAVLFVISGGWHVWQAQHYHSWKMTLLLPVGCLFYAAGLVTREVSSFLSGNNGLFIASRVLILDATAVAAASNYFLLARTLYYLPSYSPLNPQRAVQIFIFLDWIVGITACVGLSYVYNDDHPAEVVLGAGFVRASLVLQAVLYALYLGVLGAWHHRASRDSKGGVEGVKRWLRKARWYLGTLYVCGVLILIRCIYRTIEYFQDHLQGYLATHEAYFYVLDALLILGMVVVLNASHPGRYFPEDCKIYLTRDGLREVRGPGWADERRWWWALIDPLGMGEWMKERRKGKGRALFWERTEAVVKEEVEVEKADARKEEASVA